MNFSVALFMIAAALIVAGIMLAVIFFTKRPSRLNIDQYRTAWLQIENSLLRDQPMTYHMAILNADKLLDKALKELSVSGDTMGERMKSAKGRFSNNNAVWAAHKLRNQIAHEQNVSINYTNARRALASFKRALKDVGAI